VWTVVGANAQFTRRSHVGTGVTYPIGRVLPAIVAQAARSGDDGRSIFLPVGVIRDLKTGGARMPERKTIDKANNDKRQGKSPTTQAGEFVREEMHHIRQGKHGARSTKQAIAIGLSKARRSGVPLAPPKPGQVSEKTQRSAERAYKAGQRGASRVSRRRSRAMEHALKREDRTAASKQALAKQAQTAAQKRSPSERSAAARRAARTKGPKKRSVIARKAARTRNRHKA
jgi:hypothetical protein